MKVDGEELLNNEESKGKIAGLEPVNFITAATPHLGSRGNKQVCISLLIAFVFIWYPNDKKILNHLHATTMNFCIYVALLII